MGAGDQGIGGEGRVGSDARAVADTLVPGRDETECEDAMQLKCRWVLTLVAALAFVVPAGVSAQPVASDEFRVTLLIGEDLMAFRVEREQVVQLPARTP